MPIQDTSDFTVQQAQLARRQQMADMLRKQSMEQSSGDMVSGHYIAPSWSQGLNKMAQALVGNKMQGEVDSGQKALADAVRGKTNEEWAGVSSDLAGREAIAQPEEGQQGPWMPAQPANPAAAYSRALQSQDPSLKQFGMQGLAKMPEMQAQQQERVDNRAWRTQEAEAARAARAEELKARMEDQRASQAERLQAQKELREMMIQAQRDTQRAIAANRPAPQAQIIQTAEGPAQLINGRAVPIVGPDGKPVQGAKNTAVNLSPIAQKEMFEADDAVQAGNSAINSLNQALKLNKEAYSGYGAGVRAKVASNLPGTYKGADATVAMDNIIQDQALASMKSIFGGNPTEGERAILLELQASSSKTPEQREAILNRAIASANNRINFNQQKAESLRGGTYMKPGGAPASPAAPAAPSNNKPATVSNW